MSNNKAAFVALYKAVKATNDIGDCLDYTAAGVEAMALVASGEHHVGKRFAFESVLGAGVVVAGTHGWAVIMESNFFMSDAYDRSSLAYYRHEGVAMDQTFFDLAIAGMPMIAITELFDRAVLDINTPETMLIQWLVTVKCGLVALSKCVPPVPEYQIVGPDKVLEIQKYPTLRRRVRLASQETVVDEDYLLDAFMVAVKGHVSVTLTNFMAKDFISKQGYDAGTAEMMQQVRDDILRRCAV